MRRVLKRRITKLNTDELNMLAGWFVASYDAGWRPEGWKPVPAGALRHKLSEIEDEQRVADGDVPWV